MEKILTVSVAAYNVEKTLKRTLNSFVSLSKDIMNKIEIIIVDDGSSDSTYNVAKYYVDKYPSVYKIIRKNNGGYGSTINASLQCANGKYYKLLDGDDAFLEKNICGLIRFLEKSNSDIVLTPFVERYDSSYKIRDRHMKVNASPCAISNLNKDERVLMHEICIKTQLLQKNKVEITKNCFYTDVEFVLYCLIFSRTVCKYDLPVYEYYLGVEGQSVSRSSLKKNYFDTIKVADKSYELLTNYYNLINKHKITDIIFNIINSSTNLVLYSTMLLKNGGHHIYKKFDLNMKDKYPLAYEVTMEHKKIKFLRKTGYFTYWILKPYILLKNNEN